MSTSAAIARQQLQSLTRSRTFALMLGVLLVMTGLAGLIGWSSHSTILRVYDATVRELPATGRTVPPNPLAKLPRLDLLNNMIIYVPLIGALLAIVMGHQAITHDRQSGVTRVIFSRPVARAAYVRGKLAACALAILVIMIACAVLSAIALTLINRSAPTGPEIVRLSEFYAVSALYLFVFALIGMVAALVTRSQSMGLFAAIAVWVLVTFATPQFTSGLRPVASLNPVIDPITPSASPFFAATSKLEPFAVTVQYKALSSRILTAGYASDAGDSTVRLAPIAGLALILGAAATLLVRRLDVSEEAPRD